MQYDTWGNLTRRRSELYEQHYTYDAENCLLQEQHEGEQCSTYIYDPNEAWSPLARVDHLQDDTAGEIYWFSTDLNGAPLEATDEQGDIRWSGQYGSFGEVRHQTDGFTRMAQNTALPHQPLRYAGQYANRETGLHYNLFRYYDPQTGRFIMQEPIGLNGGWNLYQYAPNPLGWIDPWGLSAGDIFIHYTDEKGLMNIMKSGVIMPNAQGKVYVTDILMSPQDAYRDIFINDMQYAGRGEYAIIFKAKPEQMANIKPSAYLEYIHKGPLKFDQVLHAGNNSYGILKGFSYEEHLSITNTQVDARKGKYCG